MADSILRITDVTTVTKQSKPTIYRLIKAGAFPEPISLGIRAVGWRESDVQKWIADRPRAVVHDLGIGRGRKRASS